MLPVTEGEHADLPSFQTFFQQHSGPGVSEGPPGHTGANRRRRLLLAIADGDTLAGRQSVGLDHAGAGVAAQVVQGPGFFIEDRELRAGRSRFLHHLPRKALAGLQAGSSAGGTEYRNADGVQCVRQSVGQRRFRAHHHQVG